MAGAAFAFRSCTIPFHVADMGVKALRSFPSNASKAVMPKVPSLVFDIELEEAHTQLPEEEDFFDVIEQLRCLLRPVSITEHKLAMDVHEALQDVCILRELETTCGASPSDYTHSLADELLAKGYRVHVRTAVGGGQGGECLRNLRHTFLCCMLPGKGNATKFTVDPKFREQFEIAHSTARYAALLSEVPDVYVGLEDRLPAVVELLCMEMCKAFQQLDNVVPPWRQATSMLSKWRPRRSLDNTPDTGRRAVSETAPFMCYASEQSSFTNSGSGSKSSGSWEPLKRYTGGDFPSAPADL